MIRSDGPIDRSTKSERRMAVLSSVTEIAFQNVPILSDHVWFVLHCIVLKPSLVKLLGSVASTSGVVYHMGQVENATVPGEQGGMNPAKLYLIANSVAAVGNDLTVLSDKAGATLGLVWVADGEELHNHLWNALNSCYVHIGTEAGNTFRCHGFCDWQYYDRSVFQRMTGVGRAIASSFGSTNLTGNTRDSARVVNTA